MGDTTTVAQLLEYVFKQYEFDIEIIQYGSDDFDRCTFTPLYGKLGFRVNGILVSVIATNANPADPNDKNGNDVTYIAAAVYKELKYEAFRTYFILS